jgi:hypothetical protein
MGDLNSGDCARMPLIGVALRNSDAHR